jgi:hypothetical protein
MRNEIMKLLKTLHPSEAIALVESIGKELRKKNSVRISKGTIKDLIEFDRPDLESLKIKK